MVQAHIKAGALTGVAPDDLTYPLAPPVEAVRLGLYALVRLGSYEALAAAVLDANGQPVSTLVAGRLCAAAGRRSARGAGAADAAQHARPLHRGVCRARARDAQRRRRPRPRCDRSSSSARAPARRDPGHAALAAIRDAGAVPVLDRRSWRTRQRIRRLRLEAMTALGALATTEHARPAARPASRISARRSAPPRCGRSRGSIPTTFLTALAGLDPDRDWTVRVAAGRRARHAARGAEPAAADRDAAGPRSAGRSRGPCARWPASKAPGADGGAARAARRPTISSVRAAAANALADLKAAAAVPAAGRGLSPCCD